MNKKQYKDIITATIVIADNNFFILNTLLCKSVLQSNYMTVYLKVQRITNYKFTTKL